MNYLPAHGVLGFWDWYCLRYMMIRALILIECMLLDFPITEIDRNSVRWSAKDYLLSGHAFIVTIDNPPLKASG